MDEPVATHEDVTTIMASLGDIYDETKRIRWLLEEDDGEPEAEEDDLDELRTRREFSGPRASFGSGSRTTARCPACSASASASTVGSRSSAAADG